MVKILAPYGRNYDLMKPLYSTVRTTGLSTCETTQRDFEGIPCRASALPGLFNPNHLARDPRLQTYQSLYKT